VCEKHLAAAVSGETEFLHNLGLLCLGHGSSIKVGALAVGVTLQLLKALLIMEPLVGQELTAIHASDRNDHLYYCGL